MGWSNYIVIPKLKLMFEVSRYCSDEWVEYIRNDLVDLNSLFTDMTPFIENENVPFVNLSAAEMNLRYMISQKLCDLLGLTDYYFEEYMFMLMLDKYKIEWVLKSESEIEESKDEYKGYKKVMRFYE